MATLYTPLQLALIMLTFTGAQEATPENETRYLRQFGRPIISSLNSAVTGRFPYFVRLYGAGLCGGSLVAPDVVLTAASCQGQFDTAEIGREDLFGLDTSFETFGVSYTVAQPAFRASADGDVPTSDLMLVKLDGLSNMPHINLNADSAVPSGGASLLAMGYGSKAPVMNPDKLIEIPTSYVPNDVCETMMDPNESISLVDAIHDEHLCTANPGLGICSGDQGGPLVMLGNSFFDDIQVGVISTNFGCANPLLPDVHQRVSFDIEWIEEIVCEISDSPPLGFNCLVDVIGGRVTDEPESDPSSAPTVASPPTDPPNPPSTAAPHKLQTDMPSASPSGAPSSSPSGSPTVSASSAPSQSPSVEPSLSPSALPSSSPSATPSQIPSQQPTTSMAPTSLTITIKITFDGFPGETGWVLLGNDGGIVKHVPYLTYESPITYIEETVPIEAGANYTFVMNDFHGDGLCCPSPGNYVVESNGNVVAKGSGNFGYRESTRFVV